MDTTTVRPAAGVVFRRLSPGRGGVLLHLETGAYHGINETGVALWELMGESAGLDSVVDAFLRLLADPPAEAAAEARGFFADLAARGLVEITPA
jgi:hypothetical protein